jgi:large subunit ribosomal protein L3
MEMAGILGKKLGMTQVFHEDGTRIPVTLIEAGPCVVLKSYPKGNLQNVQLGFGDIPSNSQEKHIKRPQLGAFRKLNVKPKRLIREVVFSQQLAPQIGSEVTVTIFKEGDFVDIVGNSIGKGFQGGMKRWNWTGGFMTHGSTSHRRMGSVGSNTTPGRVFRGHHMPGHMGNKRVTVQNLKVIRVQTENNLLVVKGAVTGYKNSYLLIQKSKKKAQKTVKAKK